MRVQGAAVTGGKGAYSVGFTQQELVCEGTECIFAMREIEKLYQNVVGIEKK
jgi:hypothetical protein